MTSRHPHLHLICLHTHSLLLIPAPEVWDWKEKPHVFKPPCSSAFTSGLFLVINWLCSVLGDISLEKFLSLEAKLENQFPWVLSRTVGAGREMRSRTIFSSWGDCCSLACTWFVAQSLTNRDFIQFNCWVQKLRSTTRIQNSAELALHSSWCSLFPLIVGNSNFQKGGEGGNQIPWSQWVQFSLQPVPRGTANPTFWLLRGISQTNQPTNHEGKNLARGSGVGNNAWEE